ncbi:MAG: rhomboid family intramembrane serine protease [Cyanobacteria bacterium P01_E01_bin.6]
MVPLRDDNPVKITPYITYGLIAINLLIFVIEMIVSTTSPDALETFFYQWAVVPKELTNSFLEHFSTHSLLEWSTLITAQFLHAGFFHVAGNMLYLWIFGNNVEEEMGRLRFLIFYLSCGILAALAQWFFAPDSAIPSLGASGAIAGVMGAYIFRYPKVRILTFIPFGFIFFTPRIPAYLFLGIWFLQQAAYGFASLGVSTNIGMEGGGIAYWAHAGGFAFGALLGPFFGLFDHLEEGDRPTDIETNS